MVPARAMTSDPDTAELLASGDTQAWFAPGRAMVAYAVARGELYNVAVSVPRISAAFTDIWTAAGDVVEFRSLLGDFCPLAQELVGLVDCCARWTLQAYPSCEVVQVEKLFWGSYAMIFVT